MQAPFTLGELSGEYQGWIDQYLALLSTYIITLEQKYEKEISMLDIRSNITEVAMFIAGSRASYWYLCTNEKVRAMSEVLFTQRMLTKTTDTRFVNNSVNHLYIVDKAFKCFPEKNVWWETFLHHFASFYRRLRRTRYLLMNTESIPKHKKKELFCLTDLYESSIMYLTRPVETLLPEVSHGALDPGFFIDLPQDQKCYVCAVEIGGKKAQLQLQLPEDKNIWNVDDSKTIEEKMLIRDPRLPIIFEEEYKRGFVVTCGVNPNCNAKAHEFQLEVHKHFAKANLRFLIQTQKCEGCLTFSCETHRCSGCKRIRYCSQKCLVDNWKVHQSYCKQLSENKSAEVGTIGCRKLEGENRKVQYDWCVDWLGKCDTIIKLCFLNWQVQGIGIEKLLPKEPKKRKKKKTEQEQPLSDANTEDVGANKDKQDTETAAEEEEEEESVSVKVIRCSSVKPTDIAAKLRGLFENDGYKVSVFALCGKGKDSTITPLNPGEKCKHHACCKDKNDEESEDNSSEEEEHENLQKVRKIVQQHRKNTMFKESFEIRHVKSQAGLNEKICDVVDAQPKNGNLIDQRVVCKLKDEDTQVSLKQTNLVDIHATIDDLFGTTCTNGHVYRKSSTKLSNTFVNKMLKKVAEWAIGKSYTRPDQLHRYFVKTICK